MTFIEMYENLARIHEALTDLREFADKGIVLTAEQEDYDHLHQLTQVKIIQFMTEITKMASIRDQEQFKHSTVRGVAKLYPQVVQERERQSIQSLLDLYKKELDAYEQKYGPYQD